MKKEVVQAMIDQTFNHLYSIINKEEQLKKEYQEFKETPTIIGLIEGMNRVIYDFRWQIEFLHERANKYLEEEKEIA